jgi:6-phosphogluconolactonase
MLIDSKRTLIVPGDYTITLAYCADHFVKAAMRAIQQHGAFFVALSGGSTPKALFERISSSPYKEQIDWSKVHLFWSDERSVPPSDPDSNYGMAMHAGLEKMPIPKTQIHRMCAEIDIEKNALAYEETIKKVLQGAPFDLIMLGVGEDGHTASLFPDTEGLKETKRLIIANHVPQKKTWRMTMTFPCLNNAHLTLFYVLGASKKEILSKILPPGDKYPSQHVGTPNHPALFIADDAAMTE